MQSIAIPDTPAGRQVRHWLDCLQRGDRDRLQDFATQHYSASALAQLDANTRAALDMGVVHRETRGLLAARVERSHETELVLLARAQLTGELLRLHSAVEAQPPHPIIGIHVNYVQPADDPYPTIVSDAELVAELRGFVDLLASADCFSGTLLLARGEKVLLECSHGLASRELGIPNRPATRFNHASIQKMFTAVAIAQLAQRGRLDFADTLGSHLPDYSGAVAQNVTIHHLLTHTSGLRSYSPFTERYAARRSTLRTVSDHLALIADEPLGFKAGEHSYSNAGYIILGALVEQLSGQDYYEYVREHIYQPAGMTDTESDELGCEHPNRATGYTRRDPNGPGDRDGVPRPLGPIGPNAWALPQRGSPAGMGVSTVRDLRRFARALLTHKLLSAALTARVLAGNEPLAAGYSYGYGFEECRFGATRSVGHGGRYAGVSADFALYPELDYTVAVLANCDPPAATRIGNHARRLIEASEAANLEHTAIG